MSKKTIHYWMNAEIVTNSIAWWYFCIQFHHIWYNWIELRLWTVQWTPTRPSVMDFWVQEVLVLSAIVICWFLVVFGQSVLALILLTRLKIYIPTNTFFNSPTYTNILCKPAVQILQKYIGKYVPFLNWMYLPRSIILVLGT